MKTELIECLTNSKKINNNIIQSYLTDTDIYSAYIYLCDSKIAKIFLDFIVKIKLFLLYKKNIYKKLTM